MVRLGIWPPEWEAGRPEPERRSEPTISWPLTSGGLHAEIHEQGTKSQTRRRSRDPACAPMEPTGLQPMNKSLRR